MSGWRSSKTSARRPETQCAPIAPSEGQPWAARLIARRRLNSSLTSAVSKPYGTPWRAKLAQAAMARVQERTTGRALQKALPAARAGPTQAAQESAVLRSRSHCRCARHRHLPDSGHPERPDHPLRHRRHGAGIVVRLTRARLVGAEATRALAPASQALAAVAALGEDRPLDPVERTRRLCGLRRLSAVRRLGFHGTGPAPTRRRHAEFPLEGTAESTV